MSLSLDDFQIKELLGEGSFGQVYSAVRIIPSFNSLLEGSSNNTKRTHFNQYNEKTLREYCKEKQLNDKGNKDTLVQTLVRNSHNRDKSKLRETCRNFNITNHNPNNRNDMISKLQAKFKTLYTKCVLKRIIIQHSPIMTKLFNLGEQNLNKVKKNTGELNNSWVSDRVWMQSNIKDQKKSEFLKREINILKKLNHENVIELYDWFFDTAKPHMDHSEFKSIYLVMELASEGDLFQYIRRHQTITLEVQRAILLQILEGLNYLHEQNIMHRDIKPENILFSSINPIKIKICDFGIAKSIEGNNVLSRHSRPGTYKYMHGNLLISNNGGVTSRYGKYVDYRALGVIMYELLICSLLEDEDYLRQPYHEITKLINEDTDINATAGFLLKYLLNPAIKSYSYEKIKGHQFFTGLRLDFSGSAAFLQPEITYAQLYERRQKFEPEINHYKKRNKEFRNKYYYKGIEQKLHIDLNCRDTSLWFNKYYCRYCGYMICEKCTPKFIVSLKKVTDLTTTQTHNTNSEICKPCALYLGYIERDITRGGSSKKKINKKNKIYIGSKGGKYYLKKDKNNKNKKVYIK